MKELQVFSTEWFEKYQSRILWFLNAPIIKNWFRHIMDIHCKDTINQITPNSLSYNGKLVNNKIEITTDFRTHDKYSKRLYFAFKPFWYLLHFFDWAMLDRVEALTELSFGFSTLTLYPEPGTGSTTCNGFSQYFGSTNWTTTRNAASGLNSGVMGDGEFNIIARAMFSTPNYNLIRAFFLFDTSSLTTNATISAATFSLYGTTTTPLNPDSTTVEVVSSTPASNNAIVNADYSQTGSTSFSSIAVSSWTNSAYNNLTLNASGISNISNSGISKFATRSGRDLNNQTPTGQNDVYAYPADHTGTAQDPKLVVTYTLPVGTPVFDAVAQKSGGSTSGDSFTINIGANANGIFVSMFEAIGYAATVTCGGQSMTKIHTATNSNIDIWFLANPPTGTQTIAFTFANNTGYAAIATSWIGVSSTQPDGHNDAAGGSVTWTTSKNSILALVPYTSGTGAAALGYINIFGPTSSWGNYFFAKVGAVSAGSQTGVVSGSPTINQVVGFGISPAEALGTSKFFQLF